MNRYKLYEPRTRRFREFEAGDRVRVNPLTYIANDIADPQYILSLRGTIIEKEIDPTERYVRWDGLSGLAIWPVENLCYE